MATCDDRSWRSLLVGVFSVAGVFALGIFCGGNHAYAQIIPDQTLSDRSSTITPNVNISRAIARSADAEGRSQNFSVY